MSHYTTMLEAKFLNTLENDLQAAGARLMTMAMTMDDDDRDGTIRAAEAVLIAARKVRKHLTVPNDGDLTS